MSSDELLSCPTPARPWDVDRVRPGRARPFDGRGQQSFRDALFFAERVVHPRAQLRARRACRTRGDSVHPPSQGPGQHVLPGVRRRHYVLDGTGVDAVSGTFTMPDLGDDGWTAGVAVVICVRTGDRKIEGAVDYLGEASPPARPGLPPAFGRTRRRAAGSLSPAPSSSPATSEDFDDTLGAVVQSRSSGAAPGARPGRRQLEAWRAPWTRPPRPRPPEASCSKEKARQASCAGLRLPHPRRGAASAFRRGSRLRLPDATGPHMAALAAEHVRAGGDGANAAIVAPAPRPGDSRARGHGGAPQRRLASRPRRD